MSRYGRSWPVHGGILSVVFKVSIDAYRLLLGQYAVHPVSKRGEVFVLGIFFNLGAEGECVAICLDGLFEPSICVTAWI